MTNAIQLLTNTASEMSEIELLLAQEAAEEEGDAYDFIPTKLKIGSGGINQFVTDDGEAYKEILAVIPISQKARAYWPRSEESSDFPPLCTSPDGSVGIFAADPSDAQVNAALHVKTPHPGVVAMMEKGGAPQPTYDCATCPLSQWGSADKGAGQACKAMLRLVLLIDGWATPALLTLPPTSIKPFNLFASALKSKKGAYFGVRSKLTLEKKGTGNTAYSVLSISSAGPLSLDEVKAVAEVRKLASEYVRNTQIEAGDYVNGSTTGDSADEVAPF